MSVPPMPESVPPALAPNAVPAQPPEQAPAPASPASLRPLGNLAARPLTETAPAPLATPPLGDVSGVARRFEAAMARGDGDGEGVPPKMAVPPLPPEQPPAKEPGQPDLGPISADELHRWSSDFSAVESDASLVPADSGGTPPGPPQPPEAPSSAETPDEPPQPTEATRQAFADALADLAPHARSHSMRSVHAGAQLGASELDTVDLYCNDYLIQDAGAEPEDRSNILVSRSFGEEHEEYDYEELPRDHPDRERADAVLDELVALKQDPAFTDWVEQIKAAEEPMAVVSDLVDSSPLPVRDYTLNYEGGYYQNGSRVEADWTEPGPGYTWGPHEKSTFQVRTREAGADEGVVRNTYDYVVHHATGEEYMWKNGGEPQPVNDTNLTEFTRHLRAAIDSGRMAIETEEGRL